MENINIQISGTTIPIIPFLWYREEELLCPIELIKRIKYDTIKDLISKNNINNINFSDNCYLLVQRNIFNNPKLYISYHAYSYYIEQKNNFINEKFNKNYTWRSIIIPLDNDDDIIYTNRSSNFMKNTYCSGSVYIHGGAFSPPESLKFSINKNIKKTSILIHGICDELNIDIMCLYIIINDTDNIK